MSITSFSFGQLKDGTDVTAYRIENSIGASVTLIDYGATIQSLKVPDCTGKLTDVVLGYDTAAEYEAGDGFLGATIGRVGNRIGGAQFSLNGKTYRLADNDNGNCLHGGVRGFDKCLWKGEAVPAKSGIRGAAGAAAAALQHLEQGVGGRQQAAAFRGGQGHVGAPVGSGRQGLPRARGLQATGSTPWGGRGRGGCRRTAAVGRHRMGRRRGMAGVARGSGAASSVFHRTAVALASLLVQCIEGFHLYLHVAQVGLGVDGDEDRAQLLAGTHVDEVAGEVAVHMGLGVEE